MTSFANLNRWKIYRLMISIEIVLSWFFESLGNPLSVIYQYKMVTFQIRAPSYNAYIESSGHRVGYPTFCENMPIYFRNVGVMFVLKKNSHIQVFWSNVPDTLWKLNGKSTKGLVLNVHLHMVFRFRFTTRWPIIRSKPL